MLSCARPGLVERPPATAHSLEQARDWYQVLWQRDQDLTTLKGQVKLRVSRMIFSRAVDQAIIVKRPDQLRVDSYDVFGNLIHQLRVQKNHAEIHDFERGTARSEADVSAFLGEELGLDLSPDVLMTLLVGSVPLEARGDYLGITRKGGSILRGLRSQVLIDSGQGVPIRYVGYTQSNAIYEASFSDYREQSGRLFPYRIEVAVTEPRLGIDIQFEEAIINETVPDRLFDEAPTW